MRISAIDGKNDNLEKYSHLVSNRYSNKKTVLACLLSHLNAIKQAYQNNLQQVIILEDDVDLTIYKETYQKVNYLLDNINKTDIDIIQLFSINCKVYPTNYHSGIKMELIERNNTYWGCQAYLVTYSGMRKIIELYDIENQRFNFPSDIPLIADFFIYQYLNTKFLNVPIVGLQPIKNYTSTLDSDIQTQLNMEEYLLKFQNKIISLVNIY